MLQILPRTCSSPLAYSGTELLGITQIQCHATMGWAMWPWGLLFSALSHELHKELLKKLLHMLRARCGGRRDNVLP